MANEEQLSILKQGTQVWNKWRKENPEVKIDLNGAILDQTDLTGADLSEADLFRASFFNTALNSADLSQAKLQKAELFDTFLSEANLTSANLSIADLGMSNLRQANLSEANLNSASLAGANLTDANLSGANLENANLSHTELTGATLSQANLYGVNLNDADLKRTDFSDAEVHLTIFGKSDLSKTIGLEKIVHHGPSSISTDTFARSKGKIPEIFLQGCGLSDWEIEAVKLYDPDLSNEEKNSILYKMYELLAGQALQISPLFISYSHGDGAFVDKLESQLNKKGIRFWRDVHHATSGRLETQIDRAMRLNPTVLLVLSEHSSKSDWVEHEVRTARGLEKEMGRDVLCPVALDDSWKSSRWPKRVMEQIMEYNILDFSAWKDDTKFGDMFRKLIDGLELFYKG